MILLAGIAALAVGTSLSPAALQGAVSAETGVEYDSNASRAETSGPDAMPVQPSPLWRFLVTAQLQQRGARHFLHLQAAAGGKIFFFPAVFDQDVGVLKLGYEEGARLGPVRLAAVLDYYDAYQAPAAPIRSRDFRAASTGLRLTGARSVSPRERLEATLDVDGQLFMYKPADQYSFVAPSAQLRLGSRTHAGDPELGHDIEAVLETRFDYRGYLYGRQDDFLQAGASIAWVGPALVQLGYAYQLNVSNQTEESYQRHLVLAKVAAGLPLGLYLTVKGQLNLLKSQLDLNFLPTDGIDEENRSLAMLDIERPLPKGLSLWARYTGYFDLGNLSGGEPHSYQRHTACLGLTYRRRGSW